MAEWRVYYGSGASFDSTQGPPETAPCVDVQAIVQADPSVGRHVLTRFDFYWRDRNEWFGGDLFGLWDYLARPGLKIVKFGRALPNDRYQEIMRRANNDPDLPRKSARYPDERT